MARISLPTTQFEIQLREQTRTIMNLQDMVRTLHMENAVLRQCVAEQNAKSHAEHMKILSNKIASYYSKRVNKKYAHRDVLSAHDMVLALEEIFMSVEHASARRVDVSRRSLSPAFTFAEESNTEGVKLHFKHDSVDSAQTNVSETKSMSKFCSVKQTGSKELKQKENSVCVNKKVKNGFLSLFRRKSDSPV